MHAGDEIESTAGRLRWQLSGSADRAVSALAAACIAPLLLLAIIAGLVSMMPRAFDAATHPTVELLDMAAYTGEVNDAISASGHLFNQRVRADVPLWLRFDLPIARNRLRNRPKDRPKS